MAQQKNTMWWIAAAVVIIAAVWFMVFGGSEGTRSEDLSAGVLSAAEDSADLGTISMADGTVTHEFAIRNTGEEPVSLEKVYTSCMCTTAYITDGAGRRHGMFGMPGHGLQSRPDVVVAPGESVAVQAVFDPAAHGPSGVGLARRSIYLETNSASHPKLELSFRAMVTR